MLGYGDATHSYSGLVYSTSPETGSFWRKLKNPQSKIILSIEQSSVKKKKQKHNHNTIILPPI